MKRLTSFVALALITMIALSCSKKDSPTSPVTPKTWQFEFVGSWSGTTGYWPRHALALNGNYVYLGDDIGKIHVINVSDPTNPIEAGSWTASNGQPICRILISSSTAYVAQYPEYDTSRVYILNITSPTVPSLQGIITMEGNASVMSQSSNVWPDGGPFGLTDDSAQTILAVEYFVNTAGSGGLCHLYDVTNPYSPTFVSALYNVISPCVSGHYLYGVYGTNSGTTQDFTLNVYDISNPAAPALVGSPLDLPWLHHTGTSTACTGISLLLSGNRLYLAGSYITNNVDDSTVTIFDITSPASPAMLGTATLSGTTARYLAVRDTILYTLDEGSNLAAINVKSTSQPVQFAVNASSDMRMAPAGKFMEARNDLVYVGRETSNTDKGLLIMRLVRK